MTTIIGLDPALTRTGVARWRDGRLSTMTIATNAAQPIEARIRWICGNIWPLITKRTFVVLEAPYVTSNGDTTMKLAGLHYILRYGLYARQVPFGVFTPSQLKAFATGRGSADKAAMVALAAATFGNGLAMGRWTATDPDDVTHARANDDVDGWSHEADALWCMAAALHHVGVSAAPGGAMEPGLDAVQSEYLRKASHDWPELEWEK